MNPALLGRVCQYYLTHSRSCENLKLSQTTIGEFFANRSYFSVEELDLDFNKSRSGVEVLSYYVRKKSHKEAVTIQYQYWLS